MSKSVADFFIRHALDKTHSTNDIARELAEMGAPEGTLVTARHQSAGRGRRGNQWESTEGNVFLSLVLRPDGPPQVAAQVSFVMANAVRDLVAQRLPSVPTQLKWPNDVLCGGKKISGILLEAGPLSDGRIAWLIAGAGINVTAKPTTRLDATTLHNEGDTGSDAVTVIADFCERFLFWYEKWQLDGFEPVRTAWLANAHGLAKQIQIRLPHETIDAVFDGIDETGALLARLADGSLRKVTGGEVYFASLG
ncbi:MAG: biotin--[acetyl-CoA-carboxylase] ligase [Alphaproteobacteria bacterium]|nr:biotin--[acetyl-CoA-carboxylase] ligase [Alphaproteobacteria bacterium]